MLAVKIVVFFLVISNGVLGRDTRRGSVRHRAEGDEYKYNHPPAPENFEAIPVAVVYEDESSRVDKSIKGAVGNNVEQVDKATLKPDSSVTEEPNDIQVSKNHIDKIPTNVEQEETKVTTYRPQKEQHIPVAVVYDQEPTYYQKPGPNRNRVSNKRRKPQRPVLEEHQSDVEDTVNSGSFVNGHTGSIPTGNKPEHFNPHQKVQRPISISEEKQIVTVEDKIGTSAGKNENVPPVLAVDITEIMQTTAQTDPNSEQGNEFPTSSSKTEKLEQLQPVQENRQTIAEGSIRSKEQYNENSPSISSDEPVKLNSRTEDRQRLPSRGNLTRVRDVIPIIQSENLVFSQSGNFQYSYEGGDGTKAFEKGELRTFDNDNAGEAVSGGFSYTAKDGNEYSLSYTADENGYRPVGAHLPTPPPIPPAIARALAYLATKPTPEPVTESLVEYDQ